MEPQDDPEARIRALERPLADTARATELGTTPYTSGGAYHSGSPDINSGRSNVVQQG